MIDQFHPANPKVKLHPSPPYTVEWVKFKTENPLPVHAHKCPEGYYVGIYVRQTVDSYGNPINEHIAPVDTHGENLFAFPRVVVGSLDSVDPAIRGIYDLQPKNNSTDLDVYVLKSSFGNITLDPTKVSELHHAEDLTHLPKNRIDKTLKDDPNHQLPAWHRRQTALKQISK